MGLSDTGSHACCEPCEPSGSLPYRKDPIKLLLHSKTCSQIYSAKNNEVSANQEKDMKLVKNHILRAVVKSSVSTWEDLV